MSIPNGGGYPPGPPNVPPNVPGPPGGGWYSPPPGSGPVPPSGPLPPGGPPNSGSWPPHGYPYGPPPPSGGGRRNTIIAAVVGTVVVIVGVIVAIVLISGDDDKGTSADPSDSVSTTVSKSSSASASTSPSTSASASTSPSETPTTQRPTTSAPPAGGTVLGNLSEGDCIAMPEMTFVTQPIAPVPCSGPDAHWKIVGLFTGGDVGPCEQLPPPRGYIGHLKEFSSTGRVACLGFTRNTTLEDLKGLAGAAAEKMTQAEFDALKQSYEDRGYKIE